MASVFTYDPDPPKVLSPWPVPPRMPSEKFPVDGETPQPATLAECGIMKLEAEPQDGPTEYKLHLLLRPRKSFSSSSLGQHVSGSHLSARIRENKYYEGDIVTRPERTSPLPVPTAISRQNRLQHLTTQLLWRLQQSSPYHSSSSSNLVLPTLPEATPKLGLPSRPDRLLPGLEESRGALYEIGVSDDGTFVGLTEDEMEESVTNLRAMAASLGCKVNILRKVLVAGYAQGGKIGSKKETQAGALWVSEVLVFPDLGYERQIITPSLVDQNETGVYDKITSKPDLQEGYVQSKIEQLRVSLTGSTTSGKSSLLGTLSTSTLDNGRGKSRLSLLKHRHEIASGVTSSVAPELIGYQSVPLSENLKTTRTSIVNYASGNVSAWNDIHSASGSGRLVFLTDSAGHPRYRRTTVRGLVSWAPHWTICCIPADDDEDSGEKVGATASAQEVLGNVGAGIDLSRAHLELCLKLGLSLVVAITKLDLATKGGLRQILGKVLSTIKLAARQPIMLKASSAKNQGDLQKLLDTEEDEVTRFLASMQSGNSSLVPIVLTSAVNGTGIGTIHALLRHLPVPTVLSATGKHLPPEMGDFVVFHIDEVFPASEMRALSQDIKSQRPDQVSILSGHLRYGALCVGDEVLVGPVLSNPVEDFELPEMHRPGSVPNHVSKSPKMKILQRSVQQSPSGDFQEFASRRTVSPSLDLAPCHWQRVRIVSVRNLRLPVRKLLAGQVGTVGVSNVKSVGDGIGISQAPNLRLRKGMILASFGRNASLSPLICCGFAADFRREEALGLFPGALVIVYIASIRAPAKVLTIGVTEDTSAATAQDSRNEEFFDFDGYCSSIDQAGLPYDHQTPSHVRASFQFTVCREWIELGTQVLVMPGGSGPSSVHENGDRVGVGLEGFVGKITQCIE